MKQTIWTHLQRTAAVVVMLAVLAPAAVAAAGTQLTATQLAYAAIRGMTESFNDSHVGFLTPDANRERLNRQRGQAGFTGAGLIIRALEGRIYVTSVIPGSPAEQAGVRDFDRILRIDNTNNPKKEKEKQSYPPLPPRPPAPPH